jgi:hypothetical protein
VTPEEVFTPAAPVREEMFATRRQGQLQDRVQGVLMERGRQLILYGLTGVGKTSLVNYLCRQRDIQMLRAECGAPFDQMLKDVLARLVGEEEIERLTKEGKSRELGFRLAKLLGYMRTKATGTEVRTTPIQRSLPALTAETLSLLGVEVLFLDNFENLNGKPHQRETTQGIIELLKMLADRSGDGGVDTKLVVAGIPEASEELLALDEAAARRTAQIEVPRMPPDELDQILARGGERLGLEFEGFCRERIVFHSDGFPYYTHLFGLHCARRALAEDRATVTIEDFEHGLDAILADCDLVLRRDYEKAVETSGDTRVRKTVMEAMATMNELEVPFKAIRERFMHLHPGKYDKPEQLNFISTAIKPLKDDYGVLLDRGKPKSKNNMYRFKNPLMRGYVRLRMAQEQRRGIPLPLPPS